MFGFRASVSTGDSVGSTTRTSATDAAASTDTVRNSHPLGVPFAEFPLAKFVMISTPMPEAGILAVPEDARGRVAVCEDRVREALNRAAGTGAIGLETTAILRKFESLGQKVTIAFCDFESEKAGVDARPHGKIIGSHEDAVIYIRFDHLTGEPGSYYEGKPEGSIEMVSKTLTHELTHLRDYRISLPGDRKAEPKHAFDRFWSETNAHLRHANYVNDAIAAGREGQTDPFSTALRDAPPDMHPTIVADLLISKAGYNFESFERFLRKEGSFEGILENKDRIRRIVSDNGDKFPFLL